MALARDLTPRGNPRDSWYNARRFGALGLVSLASCVLRAAIGLYQRQMISQSLTHKDVITFKPLRSVWSGGGYGR